MDKSPLSNNNYNNSSVFQVISQEKVGVKQEELSKDVFVPPFAYTGAAGVRGLPVQAKLRSHCMREI